MKISCEYVYTKTDRVLWNLTEKKGVWWSGMTSRVVELPLERTRFSARLPHLLRLMPILGTLAEFFISDRRGSFPRLITIHAMVYL